MTKALVPDARHAKCYANARGGCSTTISGEHYISHGLIKLYGNNDPSLKYRHDSGRGVRQFVSAQSFKTNVLCTDHNSYLSAADTTALEFATFLRDIAMRFDCGGGSWGGDEHIVLSAEELQRWVLKVLINHLAGRVYAFQDDHEIPVPTEATDVLLGYADWPKSWGLFVAGLTSNTKLAFDPFLRREVFTTAWWGGRPFFT